MGVFNKLKNILFEDVEEDIPVITETTTEVEEQLPTRPEEVSRFRNINYEKEIEIEESPVEEVPVEEETSPFQQFDEEEFERIATINKNRLMERDRKLREEKMEMEANHKKVMRRETPVIKEEPVEEVVAPKKFIPSPVISPVYGVLDKNYRKEDFLPRASSDGTLPKIMDVDSVREKAFGVLEDEEESIINDEVKITTFEDEEVEEDIVKPKEKVVEDDIEEDIEKDLTDNIPEIEEDNNEVVLDKNEDDELESDLFNLIDSMYQDEEE